jgi:hypothetical protein
MSMKSRTCMGAVSKTPVTEYASEAEAREGAAYALTRYGRELEPYRCDRCHWWHLAPTDRQTPSSTCYDCVGRDGRPKASYESADAAERRADIVRRENYVSLRAYPCPHGGGWHLTKG